jgi:alkylated DNA repair protein (DNA oxidative demethylase)
MKKRQEFMEDLFGEVCGSRGRTEALADGAVLFRGLASAEAHFLVEAVRGIVAAAPFRHMVTPGGHRMSVAMTNCGQTGWVADKKGYRYDPIDPLTGKPWPAMPVAFLKLAERAAVVADFGAFKPDSCLINRYEPGARLSLHQDRNERSLDAPIVSVSLGLPVIFIFGRLHRSDKRRRIRLESGDVVVWGGPARLAFHGVEPLADGDHPLTGRCRMNLTFRRAL